MADDEASSALIARLLHQDELENGRAPLVGGSSDHEGNHSDDDDFMPPSTTAAKRKATAASGRQRKKATASSSSPEPVKAAPVQTTATTTTVTTTTSPKPVKRKVATLAELIHLGLVAPNDDVLSVNYQNQHFTGSLLPDGSIKHTAPAAAGALIVGTVYPTASAWSIVCKRSVNATKRADNGWQSVKYDGIMLNKIKDYCETADTPNKEQFWAAAKRGELPRVTYGRSDAAKPISSNEEGADAAAQPTPLKPTPPKAKRKAASSERDSDLTKDNRPAHDDEATVTQAMLDEARQMARARLRKPKPSMFHRALADKANSLDAHDLVKCEQYTREDLPYKVTVSTAALMLMDVHAHLAHTEIIGYLAGTWDPVQKALIASAAYPCRSLEGGHHDGNEDEMEADRNVNVEMDPESEMDVRSAIFDRGLIIVGWYHSHPLFEPNPSIRDLENQRSYQKLFQCEQSKLFPFVGVILSPYDAHNENAASTVRCFVTDEPVMRPMEMPFTVARNAAEEGRVLDELGKLVAYYKPRSDRVYMDNIWRDNKGKRDKLCESVRAHCVDQPSESEQQLIDQIKSLV